MADDQALLSVRAVRKIYKMGEVEVAALDGVSIDVRRGEMLAVVGPSGSGKTTLLNVVGGMDRPTQGQVLYRSSSDEEFDLAKADDRRLTRYRRSEIGFVFQFFNLVPTLTARENVQVATEISADPMDPVEALDLVGLADRADSFPSQLSGGQQQRIAIARAVAGNPSLLLCDEPTGALDTETSRDLLKTLRRLNEELGKTIIVITHDLAIPQATHRCATLHDGRIASVTENAERADPEEMEW